MVQTTSYMCWTMSTTRSRCFRSIRPAARWRLSPEAPSRCFRVQATKILGQTRSPYSTEGDERQFAKCVATRGLKRGDTSEPRCQLLEALPGESPKRISAFRQILPVQLMRLNGAAGSADASREVVERWLLDGLM